jgi:hypothetical protein
MVVFPCRGGWPIEAFAPLGILQFVPYAKNDPLGHLMRGWAFEFAFSKKHW